MLFPANLLASTEDTKTNDCVQLTKTITKTK